ncbi:protein YIPF5 [Agrilus planipennis]|uniref:Protein YIPF5 n=1 Tax=Agrilus planipennis TaxID=224129 RepID=A0A1W4W8R1_AGRPL|nr:protein YIPF5 [Agrilus planipennis]XP_018320443.1 protein YIPF5 [Agrilus planipennis]XP_018320444.1 protein YIPF5 [Agrilus planipennis]
MSEKEYYWNVPNQEFNSFGDNEYHTMQTQQFEFQSFGEVSQESQSYYNPNLVGKSSSSMSFLQPQDPPGYSAEKVYGSNEEWDEPPLLEELEIYPDRILEKTLAVLNPFRGHSLADDSDFLAKDTDLAGPVAYCLTLAMCLFISGNKAHFGYIYGLSVMSCLMMYCLLSLMTTTNNIFTLTSVASILGYCLLPIVALAVIGVFTNLSGPIGIGLAVLAVVWSSLSASRLFVAMSGDTQQRPLIAYPCALVSGVFALLVVF